MIISDKPIFSQLPARLLAYMCTFLNQDEKVKLWATCKFFQAPNGGLAICWQNLCNSENLPLKPGAKITWKQHYEAHSKELKLNFKAYMLQSRDEQDWIIDTVAKKNRDIIKNLNNTKDLRGRKELLADLYDIYANVFLDDSIVWTCNQDWTLKTYDRKTCTTIEKEKGAIVNDLIIRKIFKNRFGVRDIKSKEDLIELETDRLSSCSIRTLDVECFSTDEQFYLKYDSYKVATIQLQKGAKIHLMSKEAYSIPNNLISTCKIKEDIRLCGYNKIITVVKDVINIYNPKGELVKALNMRKFFPKRENYSLLRFVDENTLLCYGTGASFIDECSILKIDLIQETVHAWPLPSTGNPFNYMSVSSLNAFGDMVITVGGFPRRINFWDNSSEKPVLTLMLGQEQFQDAKVEIVNHKIVVLTKGDVTILERKRDIDKNRATPVTQNNDGCTLF